MVLEKIEAHNFKSFRDLNVELGQLNVLIGANASGKSNVVQLLRLLRDIANLGLDNASSIQGGKEFLANLQIGFQVPLRIKVQLLDDTTRTSLETYSVDSPFKLSNHRFIYDFSLRADPSRQTYRIKHDTLSILRDVFENTFTDSRILLGTAKVTLTNGGNGTKPLFSMPDGVLREQVFSRFWTSMLDYLSLSDTKRESMLLEGLSTDHILPTSSVARTLAELPIYDFHAKLPKETAQITGKVDLEEDGSNLVIALKHILEDEEQRRSFSNLLEYALPFAAEVDVQRLADRFLHFRLRETYLGDKFLPASLLSDGTINIIALIVALYFSDKPLIVIEEPERNIHPYLIARVAEMLKDASRHKQIIVTTHSPELVKNVALDDLLLVSRDREGFSTVQKPSESAHVRTFLENEIGVEDLFARNLLGA